MPDRAFDMTPAEQQAWADAYRAENVNDRTSREQSPRSPQGTRPSPAGNARDPRACDAPPAVPRCEDEQTRGEMLVGSRRVHVCPQCRPVLLDALAQHLAADELAEGRTRRDAEGVVAAGQRTEVAS